jgi:hypothetical protein
MGLIKPQFRGPSFVMIMFDEKVTTLTLQIYSLSQLKNRLKISKLDVFQMLKAQRSNKKSSFISVSNRS